MLLTLIATDAHKIAFKDRVLSDIKENRKTLGSMFYNKYPLIIGDVVYLITSIVSNDKYKYYEDNLKTNNAIIDKDNRTSAKNIIIVMGESSSSSRYGIYGYNINTTPNMKNIFSQNGGCIIKDAHSAAPITRDSIAMTFSFATPESEEPLFKEKNIIDLAKENGYKTYWLSSQELSGLHASKFGYIAKKSDVIKLTKGKDDKLNNLLVKTLQDTGKKFIVLHLAGSHGPYTNFDNLDKKALPNSSEYDLTIDHTDRVINDINNTLKSKLNNYILFYTSDHGEIIDVGHGLKGAREQYLVPLMILDKNQHAMCAYVNSLVNEDGYISGLMNKYIVSKMIGYKLNHDVIKSDIKYDRIIDANNRVLFFNEIKNYH